MTEREHLPEGADLFDYRGFEIRVLPGEGWVAENPAHTQVGHDLEGADAKAREWVDSWHLEHDTGGDI